MLIERTKPDQSQSIPIVSIKDPFVHWAILVTVIKLVCLFLYSVIMSTNGSFASWFIGGATT